MVNQWSGNSAHHVGTEEHENSTLPQIGSSRIGSAVGLHSRSEEWLARTCSVYAEVFIISSNVKRHYLPSLSLSPCGFGPLALPRLHSIMRAIVWPNSSPRPKFMSNKSDQVLTTECSASCFESSVVSCVGLDQSTSCSKNFVCTQSTAFVVR